MPSQLSLQWLPFVPVWYIVLLAVGLIALLAWGTVVLAQKQVPRRWIAILGGWRLAIITVFVTVLLQPVLSYTRSIERRPELLVLIDTSQSMGLPGAGSASRLEEVREQLQKSDLLTRLQQNYRLHWYAFDETARSVREDDVPGLRPSGSTTRYGESLMQAGDLLRTSGINPDRVLLVSDGHDRGTVNPVEAARRLGVVVDVLAPGSPAVAPETDAVVIRDIQSAKRVLLGSDTHFRITLHSGRPARVDRSLTLTVQEDGRAIGKQAVVFPRGATEQRVLLAHRPTRVGIRQYDFQLGDKPYHMSVQVVDNKNEILLLEDAWRWEFKFLRRVIEDDPSLRFTATLPRDGGAYVQFGSPERRVQLIGFPQNRAELEGFDTFLLGDVNLKRWPRGLASAVAQLVRDEGRSLILLAGPNVSQLADVPELNALLPVELTPDSGVPVPGPIEVRLTRDGLASPFFEPPAGARSAFSRLPPLDQVYPPLRKRPGATVLLEAARAGNAYGNLIVMAEQTVGRGRVLFVGTDTLWKWQTLVPADETKTTPHTAFWQQAFRALTPLRPGLSGVQLWLQADRSRYEAGQPVRLRAELQTDHPLNAPRVQATVVLPDERRLPLAFTADPAVPEVLQAVFTAPVPGAYHILGSVVADGQTSAETTAVIDVTDSPAEQADTDVNVAALEHLAQATGGQHIDPARPETWPAAAPRPPELERRTFDLWNSYTLMLVLCGLLGIDWLLRLLRGYV